MIFCIKISASGLTRVYSTMSYSTVNPKNTYVLSGKNNYQTRTVVQLPTVHTDQYSENKGE